MKITLIRNAVVVREYDGCNPQKINQLLARHEHKPQEQSMIYRQGKSNILDTNIRSCTSVKIDRSDPFAQSVAAAVRAVNERHIQSNVSSYCRENEILTYEVGGRFVPHNDILYPPRPFNMRNQMIRKLTSIVLLTPPDEFTGGWLRLWDSGERYRFDWSQGDIVVFPSFVMHGVEPVESGCRKTLVSWSHGEY